MRARVIIYNPQTASILLIWRKKHGRSYWVVPGGGSKPGEMPTQTAVREINEELGLVLNESELTFLFDLREQKEVQRIFRIKSRLTRTPAIGGEEWARSGPENVYLPTWVKQAEIGWLNLMPPILKKELTNTLK